MGKLNIREALQAELVLDNVNPHQLPQLDLSGNPADAHLRPSDSEEQPFDFFQVPPTPGYGGPIMVKGSPSFVQDLAVGVCRPPWT